MATEIAPALDCRSGGELRRRDVRLAGDQQVAEDPALHPLAALLVPEESELFGELQSLGGHRYVPGGVRRDPFTSGRGSVRRSGRAVEPLSGNAAVARRVRRARDRGI